MKYSLMLKFLGVAFVYIGYYIHSFAFNQSSLVFEKAANEYYSLTSLGDYYFYSGLAEIQSAVL